MVYLFDDLNAISEEDYNIAYNLLFEERQRRVLKYRQKKDRILSVFAYILLLYGVSNENLVSKLKKFKFSYNENGKPFFISEELKNINFNISHCSKGIACAVSSQKVGVDIEEYIFEFDKIKDLVLNENEHVLINNSREPNAVFTHLWTIKEAYTKMLGCGLSYDDIRNLDFSGFENCNKFSNDYLYTKRFSKYVLTVFNRNFQLNDIIQVSGSEIKKFIRSLDF